MPVPWKLRKQHMKGEKKMAIRITTAQRKTRGIITILYGMPSVGKTSFAAGSPRRVLLLDFEGGAHRSDVVISNEIPIARAEDIDEFQDLIDLKEQGYETIIIDTLAAFVEWAINRMPKSQKKKDGSLTVGGFGAMKNALVNVFNTWKLSGISLVFLAHEKIVTGAHEEKYRTYNGGPGSTSDIIECASDLIVYMYSQENKRYVSAVNEGAQYAKDSLGFGVREIGDSSYSEIIEQVQREQTAIDEQAKSIAGMDVEELNAALNDYFRKENAVIRIAIWKRGKALGLQYSRGLRKFCEPKVKAATTPKAAEASKPQKPKASPPPSRQQIGKPGAVLPAQKPKESGKSEVEKVEEFVQRIEQAQTVPELLSEWENAKTALGFSDHDSAPEPLRKAHLRQMDSLMGVENSVPTEEAEELGIF